MSIVVDEKLFNDEDLLEDESFSEVGEETSEVDFTEDVSQLLEDDIQDNTPAKFKGKGLKDVIESYTQLEQELGRKNNEVGELRKLTDDFIKQQLTPAPEKENHKIDLDDLLENPDEVIRRALDSNPRVAQLEKQLQQAKVDDARKAFEAKHKDWEATLSSSDFQSWITQTPVRAEMFQRAHKNYEYDVADELFSLYHDVRGVAKEKAEGTASDKRQKALKATSVERGSTGEKVKRVYRRADLIRLKQTNPTRYADLEKDIMLAYTEGRVR